MGDILVGDFRTSVKSFKSYTMRTITADQYLNMSRIYTYFKCQSVSDLLHNYTLEDCMLLVVIMSNTLEDMYNTLGLDPSNLN